MIARPTPPPEGFADGEARACYVSELRRYALETWEVYSLATVNARGLAREAATAAERAAALTLAAERYETQRAAARAAALDADRELASYAGAPVESTQPVPVHQIG